MLRYSMIGILRLLKGFLFYFIFYLKTKQKKQNQKLCERTTTIMNYTSTRYSYQNNKRKVVSVCYHERKCYSSYSCFSYIRSCVVMISYCTCVCVCLSFPSFATVPDHCSGPLCLVL